MQLRCLLLIDKLLVFNYINLLNKCDIKEYKSGELLNKNISLWVIY